MFVNEDGSVSGSLDRTRLKELHDKARNKDLKAYYRDLLGDSDEGQAADATVEEPAPKPAAKKTTTKTEVPYGYDQLP